MINLIVKLRQDGGNNYFRLGTFVHMLIISRSVDHGLRADQKYIKIEAIDLNKFDVVLKDGKIIYREYRLSDLNDVRLSKLVNTLKGTLID